MCDSPPPDREPIRPRHAEYLDADGRPLEEPKEEHHRYRLSLSDAILAVCVLVFLATWIIYKLTPRQIPPVEYADQIVWLMFSPGNGNFLPQILTHMFAHATVWHLAFNMVVLYFFGNIVERVYGLPRYALLYFGSGLIAALAQAAVEPSGFLLGASGALAGVLAAFVRHFPHVRIYIWGVLPMPAWLAIVAWLGYNLWLAYQLFGASGGHSDIAIVAHFAGFGAGAALSFILIPPGSKITWHS
jgi:membrane associated rhomboid family serine protease